jgi:hypothetical protein
MWNGLMALVTIPAVGLAALAYFSGNALLCRVYGTLSNKTKLWGFALWVGAIGVYAVVMALLLQASVAAKLICPFG